MLAAEESHHSCKGNNNMCSFLSTLPICANIFIFLTPYVHARAGVYVIGAVVHLYTHMFIDMYVTPIKV